MTLWRIVASINGCMAIIMAAVGAHATADAYLAAIAEKASLYQLIHAVALLVLASEPGLSSKIARGCFAIGIALFCGSLYLKAFAGMDGAPHLAPLGGISLMAGWLAAGFRKATPGLKP